MESSYRIPVTDIKIKYLLVGAGIFFLSCGRQTGTNRATPNPEPDPAAALFTQLSPDSTFITFSNDLTEGLNTNVLLYEYFYNGGGVAVGDMNGDGLEDLYFSGNMTDNKLYLNKGHMQFQDITGTAGVAGRPGPWKTGVSVADVNGDGRPDIFVCYSGKLPGYKRTKQLFINQGNDAAGLPHFDEQAARYGLADSSYTTQAYFFDYDRDGDLDLLLLNHNPNSLPVLNEMSTAALLKKPDPMTGPRLLRNDAGHFHDVTDGSGINSSALSYGLGAGIADINGDGWPDIYLSNDYTVPDYYYVNDRKGHFSDRLQDCMGHTSQFSMGNNVGDINNDGLPDIITLDMLPEDNHRQKLLFAPDNYEKFNLTLRSGFYYQYMRNMLQLNNGDGSFSEVGQLAGISNTDWSWAPLIADLDNDGYKDLFVTNGYVRDYTNMDFIKFMEGYTQQKGRLKREDVLDIIGHMPSSNVTSYIFQNDSNGGFSNKGASWGIRTPANSNGAVWADLDNDGDLDLVVNNLNQPAFLYENRSTSQNRHHYIRLKLRGGRQNTDGIGACVTLYNGGRKQYLEQMPAQGYQSSVSPILHFGLGLDSAVDSLRIVWPGGRQQVLRSLKADQVLTVQEKDAVSPYHLPAMGSQLFAEVASPIDFSSTATTINDFKRQPLLLDALSWSGPCLAQGDINGDGLEDIFAGGGNGQAGAVYLGQKGGGFRRLPEPALEADRACQDAGALLFDANGDGRTDLYVASGGYHNYDPGDTLLQDRLYLGDGQGEFHKSGNALPDMRVSKSVVRLADINGDGSPDLFIGGRVIPGQYPLSPRSYLLINDGKGHFSDQTASLAPKLAAIGMVTDAAWTDLNGDKQMDLVVAGEWMPVTVFINHQGHLADSTSRYFDKQYTGWWNSLWLGDLDGDGRTDLVAGNLGLNSQCKANDKQPAELFYKDFDGNGAIDPILCLYIKDSSYPFLTRDELLQQVGNRSKRFPDYRTYSAAQLKDIFSPEEMKGAQHLQANCLTTTFFSMGKDGRWHEKALPVQVQYAPVYTITPMDYDGDGIADLLLCGNTNHDRLRFGKYDASYGVLLKGDGKGGFTYIEQVRSGFHLRGDVRAVIALTSPDSVSIHPHPGTSAPIAGLLHSAAGSGITLLFGITGDRIRTYHANAATAHGRNDLARSETPSR